jgi:hypothetical protein
MIRLSVWVLYSSLPPAYLCDHHGQALRAEYPNIDIRFLAGKSRISCDLCFVAESISQPRNQASDHIGQGRRAA